MKLVRYKAPDGTLSTRVYRYHGATVLYEGRHILEDISQGTVFVATLPVVEASLDEVLPEDRAVLEGTRGPTR